MVKIDLVTFIRDHCWFGWRVTGKYINAFGFVTDYQWHYSNRWGNRLWPVRRKRTSHPDWWIKIFGKTME